MKQQRLYLIAFIFVFCATAAGAVIASRKGGASLAKTAPAASPSPRDTSVKVAPYPDRIPPTFLTPQLRVPFSVLGDRMAKRGKERLSSLGTLSRSGTSLPVMVECEFPNRLRVVGQPGVLITFDARTPPNQQIVLGQDEVVETLFFDSAEYFFVAQARGVTTRFLGARVSLSEEAGATGPFYDVYEVTGDSGPGNSTRSRTKRYFFNSDTQLLEIVRYESEKGGAKVLVETRFGGWRRVQGQQVPATIARLENGGTLFSLHFTTTTVAPRAGVVNGVPPSTSAQSFGSNLTSGPLHYPAAF